jgi:hypothetical protein
MARMKEAKATKTNRGGPKRRIRQNQHNEDFRIALSGGNVPRERITVEWCVVEFESDESSQYVLGEMPGANCAKKSWIRKSP